MARAEAGQLQVEIRVAQVVRLVVVAFGQLQAVKDGFGSALVLVFMIGFFWGIIKIWGGANAISKGDSEGKAGILAGIIIAAAAAIMAALFTIFGMQDAILTPRF